MDNPVCVTSCFLMYAACTLKYHWHKTHGRWMIHAVSEEINVGYVIKTHSISYKAKAANVFSLYILRERFKYGINPLLKLVIFQSSNIWLYLKINNFFNLKKLYFSPSPGSFSQALVPWEETSTFSSLFFACFP